MSRTELLDPRRFANHVVRGLGGITNLIRDYLEQGGIMTRGDLADLMKHIANLSLYHARLEARTKTVEKTGADGAD